MQCSFHRSVTTTVRLIKIRYHRSKWKDLKFSFESAISYFLSIKIFVCRKQPKSAYSRFWSRATVAVFFPTALFLPQCTALFHSHCICALKFVTRFKLHLSRRIFYALPTEFEQQFPRRVETDTETILLSLSFFMLGATRLINKGVNTAVDYFQKMAPILESRVRAS